MEAFEMTNRQLLEENIKLRHRLRELEKEKSEYKKYKRVFGNALNFYTTLLDDFPVPIWRSGVSGRCHYFNKTWLDFVGKSMDDELNDGWLNGVHEDDAKKCIETYLNAFSKREAFEMEYRLRYNDGSYRWVFDIGRPIYDAHGEFEGYIGTCFDINSRKEAQELKESYAKSSHRLDEVIENERLKTELLANISHEFKTPINVLLSAIQLLELYTNNKIINNKLVEKNVGVMKQNCYRLLRLVNNLLDTAEIEKGTIDANLNNEDLIFTVKMILKSAVPYVNSKGLELNFKTKYSKKIIAFDKNMLERVILNLIANSVKFTGTGGIITVCVFKEKDYIVISVEDTGDGIPEDKLGLVFTKFYQTDDLLTRKHEGTGIGLSLAESFMKLHEGTINVESEIGKGTKFLVRLPDRLISNANDEDQSKELKGEYFEKANIEFSDIYM